MFKKRWFGVVLPSDQQHTRHTRWCQWNCTKPDLCWMSQSPARTRRSGSVREDQSPISNRHCKEGTQSCPRLPQSPDHIFLVMSSPFWTLSNLLTFIFDSLWCYLLFTSSPPDPSLTTYRVWGRSGVWAGINWRTCNIINGIYSSYEPGAPYFIPDLSFLQHFTVRVYGNLCHYTNYTNCH